MTYCESSERLDRRSLLRRFAVAATQRWDSPRARPARALARPEKLRVLAWSEGTAPRSVYPGDVDGAIGDHLRRLPGLDVRQARLTDPSAGSPTEALDATDVLIWWGRLRHADVPEARARAVADRVRAGKLGFVALHASCGSKPFQDLMGCTCEPGGWRDDGRPERVTIQAPDHEIARGIAPFTIPRTAMYAEPFQVPSPRPSSWSRNSRAARPSGAA